MTRDIKQDLCQIAKNIVLEKGLEPDFSTDVMQAVEAINSPAAIPEGIRDLRALPWCSIDNDDSRDLDQLTYASENEIWIAVADVDAIVTKNSPIDLHAQINTTSIYTPAINFPMLPEKLSTNLTSLNESEERLALVAYIKIDDEGATVEASIFPAAVRNYAKLAYNNVAAWLEGNEELATQNQEVKSTLRIQHELAQRLRKKREREGSLTLESPQPEAHLLNSQIMVQLSSHNVAEQIIEEFMIAANQLMATTCKAANVAILRRVVTEPKYWDQIVELAKKYNVSLPLEPDSKALDAFLVERKRADPITFYDLSLMIIKLLGRGEYVVEHAETNPSGHFALGIPNYTHSTAPNRRYPDLLVQRQYKAHVNSKAAPYTIQELTALAKHCTQQEDAVNKAQRQINKSAAAILLSSHIGSRFDGVITGINEKNCWVRIFSPATEGKLLNPYASLRVGDRVNVKLVSVVPERGFIDFTL
ncbi:MAG: RNB domain-containing ribonuclease [Verrucomicrobia bacterium]|nr:RNB domain-containing ribonuclease [Verrucomicrobiota bacterium]MBS0636343.1 RNB domain-containing ribonuclease [Verrucomicrobiota bacterium]